MVVYTFFKQRPPKLDGILASNWPKHLVFFARFVVKVSRISFCPFSCLFINTVLNLKSFKDQEWPRQTKPKKGQFMNFSQGHSKTKVRYVNRACFPKAKHQNSHKRAKFMNFSFWPFLWFGLLGRLLKGKVCPYTGPRHYFLLPAWL